LPPPAPGTSTSPPSASSWVPTLRPVTSPLGKVPPDLDKQPPYLELSAATPARCSLAPSSGRDSRRRERTESRCYTRRPLEPSLESFPERFLPTPPALPASPKRRPWLHPVLFGLTCLT